MSHLPERAEKSCLNCNAAVNGRFCSVCGQENLEPQESLGHFINHFFQDITHFDGKFFSSIKYLFKHPGFLAGEYVAGRRMSYINPIRLYVFTSAIFFLLYFGILSDEESEGIVQVNDGKNKSKDWVTRDTVKIQPGKKTYRNLAAYDSANAKGEVPGSAIRRYFKRIGYAMSELDSGDGTLGKGVFSLVNKYLPYAFLLTLPLFAGMLKLLYIRRKRFYYVAHVVFALYLYVHSYLWWLLFAVVSKFTEHGDSWPFTLLRITLILYYLFYFYKSFRNFYGQGRMKTFLKLIIMFIATGLIFGLVMLGLFLISLMSTV